MFVFLLCSPKPTFTWSRDDHHMVGEIAYQLGGDEGFAHVAKHDQEFIEPKGDVIEKFLPVDRPCLILMDEVLNYISTYRERG